jgi:choline-sulfatase
MTPTNLLILMSDEHSRRVLGCYGNKIVRTPNIDALAARGTRFNNAYTNCPICVPARAAFATGRYVHQIRNWDNGQPYDGSVPGWGHRLRRDGHQVVSIGKLHYRSSEDPNGFDVELLPMHVLNGIGDTVGLVRRPPPARPNIRKLAEETGRGETSYTRYDRAITAEACRWLTDEAPRSSGKPWVLFVSLVCPHFPLSAPAAFADLYPPAIVPWPIQRDAAARPGHPVLQALRRNQDYDDYFRDDDHRRMAIAAYYGLVSFLDDNVGKILRALDSVGLSDETRVLYTSDHGDNLGARTFWGKATMYEESAGVPLILAGSDVPEGQTVNEIVSLVDVYQTAVTAVGETLTPEERAVLPGNSLIDLANGSTPERTPLVEYHAASSITGCFMIRAGKWKYVHYSGYLPQLFDLENDPFEANDRAADPACADVITECERRLRTVVDPEDATARAFADQDARIKALGGLDAVLGRGNFPYTPAPGEAPKIAEVPKG